MDVSAVKTHKITTADKDLLAILDAYLPAFKEQTVLAITSKIVAICQGRVVQVGHMEKEALIKREADLYLPAAGHKYRTILTIKQGMLTPMAGVDDSNGAGYYILWPQDAQATANAVRAYLQTRFSLAEVGVLITDSRPAPLRVGVTGQALAYSGLRALNDYVGKEDLFGRPLRMTQVNVVDALAAAAVLVMGEGNEQTPLATIAELPFVTFQAHDPTPAEVQQLQMALEDDLYSPLLTSVDWQKGGRAKGKQ